MLGKPPSPRGQLPCVLSLFNSYLYVMLKSLIKCKSHAPLYYHSIRIYCHLFINVYFFNSFFNDTMIDESFLILLENKTNIHWSFKFRKWISNFNWKTWYHFVCLNNYDENLFLILTFSPTPSTTHQEHGLTMPYSGLFQGIHRTTPVTHCSVLLLRVHQVMNATGM